MVVGMDRQTDGVQHLMQSPRQGCLIHLLHNQHLASSKCIVVGQLYAFALKQYTSGYTSADVIVSKCWSGRSPLGQVELVELHWTP